MMKGKYLLLGTNLGNRRKNILDAKNAIASRIGRIKKCSSLYRTKAWGFENQPDFLNLVIEVDTDLDPYNLLAEIEQIEKSMGRIRFEKWKERLIDIDILYYDNLVLDKPDLKIPHPQIPNRRFTLVPLCEIAPDSVHPGILKTNYELLKDTPDNLTVEKI
jgi:2-amino-4-hydroxy-6-hydroxymethyldihydropteridine diphosphokinase